ncbi:MAG: addiction module protein, partial [Desulfamplus sp.]|nr:addiction module protein [Desulfamplus sp.]
MSTDIKTLETEALSLPVSQRALLAQHLLASLSDLDEQENERLWLEEAQRRYHAYKAGTFSSRDAFESISDMRGRL